MDHTVIISHENGGFDITVFDQDKRRVKSTWSYNRQGAINAANTFASYYRDENGQTATIQYPESLQ